MVNSQLLVILLIATVAGVILFRLYTVLGRRTGSERPPRDRFQRVGGTAEKPTTNDNVVSLPDRRQGVGEAARQPEDPLARALLDIKLADRNFDSEHFLSGARHAYELIVAAFAAGDRAVLQPLLSDEVFNAFDQDIRAREAKQEKVEFTFVGFREVKIADAALKGTLADVTVSFGAQFISATTDANGQVIEGDAKAVRNVTDLWTFERNTRASDPNWRLIATSGEADIKAH
jgi:predicted lipid-binding transport protein (Tim44 family)